MKRLFLLLFTALPLPASMPIECSGLTRISYSDQGGEKIHTVTSREPLTVDLENNLLESYRTEGDKPQTEFKDDEKEVYADNVKIYYILENNKLKLNKLNIYGHVKCIQKKADEQNMMQEAQYTLADTLSYDDSGSLAVFTAKKGENVLYHDVLNNYRISAPEVEIRRDPATGKAIVQGKGDVRFTFREEELRQFKEHFSGKEPTDATR